MHYINVNNSSLDFCGPFIWRFQSPHHRQALLFYYFNINCASLGCRNIIFHARYEESSSSWPVVRKELHSLNPDQVSEAGAILYIRGRTQKGPEAGAILYIQGRTQKRPELSSGGRAPCSTGLPCYMF